MKSRLLVSLVLMFLPWKIRRLALVKLFGYSIHPESRIGYSFIMPENLVMEAGSRIGHLTLCKGLSNLILREHSKVGNLNWISGFPAGNKSFFSHQSDRIPQLVVNRHSAVTNRHLIDCTNSVTIGSFTTFAGFRSQVLSHSIDLQKNRQSSAPITIGDYCFVGTDCVLLGGAVLPSYSVLGAKSLLNKSHTEEYCLYAGVPAVKTKKLGSDYAYFTRITGFVN
ncbi:MAG: acyltransferase [Geobacteraceae bacterium]|nr:acyltransferase [Geobacteraceae bacterium]